MTQRESPLRPFTLGLDGEPRARCGLTGVPRRCEDQIFWTSGDLTYRARDSSTYEMAFFRHFDVRFDPEAVRAIAAPAAKAKAETQAATARDVPAEEIQKGPPVSDAHLRAWFDVFRQAYTGAADTEANALASARGMFPGKSVSRDKVRELRGEQKRGRKAGDT
jgi:hypothetical protein